MPPRISSAASQQATTKARADGRARKLCGLGSMGDVVDAAFLKRELTQFYDDQAGLQDVSPGLIALNRAKRALDAIADATQGPERISKAVTRTLWALLSEEMSLAIKRNESATVQPLIRFCEKVRTEGRPNNSWDMGKVRNLLGQGWPAEQNVHRLKSAELGPLHWWFAIDSIESTTPIRRQHIYDAAFALFDRKPAPSSALRTPATRVASPPRASGSGSSRPARQAAGATNAALNNAPILDDDTGSTYAPSEAGPPQEWTFAAGTDDQFTAPAPQPAVAPPPPPPSGVARRAQPSPWLPPTGFSADIKWQVDNYKVHTQMLLRYPAGETIPNSLIWEHPNMHGCPIDNAGQPTQFNVSCTNCRKRLRKCIWRGSKACLPCFWEKGSMGKCEGGTPPVLSPRQQKENKPDFGLRTGFLHMLETAGKIEYPYHYLDKQGRAKHGAASSGAGRPPAYNPPLPDYSPPANSASSARAIMPAPGPSGSQATAVAGTPRPTSRAPTPQVSAAAPSGPAAHDGPIESNFEASATEGGRRTTQGPGALASSRSQNVPAQGDRSASGRARGDDDVAMADVSNMPASSRKRGRGGGGGVGGGGGAGAGGGAGEQEGADGGQGERADEGAPPRKRKRRGGSALSTEAAAAPLVPARGDDHVVAGPADTPPVITAATVASLSQEMSTRSEDSETAGDTPSAPEDVAADRPTRPNASHKVKGKGRATPKISGAEQRNSAVAPNRGLQFHDPVPGTRSVARAGSPNEYRLRPTPVIPDQDMRIQGDRTYEIPTSLTPITYPKPGPPVTSTVNVSGDILLANHVERAMRHEARDNRDQQRDWMIGRFKNEHLIPLHREVMESLAEMKTAVAGALSRVPEHGPATTAGTSIALPSDPVHSRSSTQGTGNSHVVSYVGPERPASPHHSAAEAVVNSPAFQGISEARMQEMLAGLTANMQRSLTVQTAPITELAGSMQDLTRRFRDMEPITGRVNEISDDLRSLVARVQRLENVGPLAHNLRVFTEHQDRAGEPAAPMLVLRQSQSGLNTSSAQGLPAAHATQPDASRASSPIAARSPALRRGSPSVLRVGSPNPVAPTVSMAVDTPNAGSDERTVSHSQPVPNAARAAPQLQAAIERERDVLSMVPAATALCSREDTPSPPARVSVPTAGAAPSHSRVPSRAASQDDRPSPLTSNPSPGNVIISSAPRLSPSVERGQHDEVQPPAGGASQQDDVLAEDDEPIETGTGWTGSVNRKRGAQELESPAGQPVRKRRAGEVSEDGGQSQGGDEDEDEDAEGSVDEEDAPPVPVLQANAARPGKGRGAGGAASTTAVKPGRRRSGLRTRAPAAARAR